VEATRSLIRAAVPAEQITEATFARHLPYPDTPDVDLVIRTSGEQRISNFMLWQVAYAEWVFPQVLWPDFRATHLWECLDAYRWRQRRFGDVRRSTTITGDEPR
jgi:undecaprenyl diphosphate synthase